MDLGTRFEDRLRDLVGTVDDDAVEVGQAIGGLQSALRRAVTSYLGMTLRLVFEGQPVNITALEPRVAGAVMRTTLRLKLDALVHIPAGGDTILVVYAATPGAWTDLAADLQYVLGQHGDLAMDEDVGAPMPNSGVCGGAELTVIQYALGILIGQGHLPHHAAAELQRQADLARLSLFGQATRVVDRVPGPTSA